MSRSDRPETLHSRWQNYMDDDTVELGCHYCRWESKGHETEDAADQAWEDHVESNRYVDRDPF